MDPMAAHLDDACGGNSVTDSTIVGMQDALSRYLDLMHDCNLARFDELFAASAHLHGYRDGAMVAWSTKAYRNILAKRASSA